MCVQFDGLHYNVDVDALAIRTIHLLVLFSSLLHSIMMIINNIDHIFIYSFIRQSSDEHHKMCDGCSPRLVYVVLHLK